MIEFYVSGQILKFYTPVIAADTLNYLTAKVNFSGSEWDGYSKWLHFRHGEELGADVFDLQLNENDEITADQQLNLDIGEWEIYLTGTKDQSRLTTIPVIMTVKESGLIDAPLHGLPMSVAEQVDYNAALALRYAQEVKEDADAGKFNGTSLSPIGHFPNVEALETIVENPQPGDVYSVGMEAPYKIYTWDGINLMWRNQGQLQGAPGEKGKDGVIFTPSVDTNGNISWVNDGGLQNPATRNIRGPAGADGATGPAGPGAYEKAKEAGYTGTEAAFYSAVANFPSHNTRHLPDGGDPITVKTGNLDNSAVTTPKVADSAITRAKLAQDALYSPVKTTGTSTSTAYSFVADDLGKTILVNSKTMTMTLSKEVAASFPAGAEIAIYSVYWDANIVIEFDGFRMFIPGLTTNSGLGGLNGSGKVKIADPYCMCALKKMTYNNTAYGDIWTLQGNVEVVT